MKRLFAAIAGMITAGWVGIAAFAQSSPSQPLPSSVLCATCQTTLAVTATSVRVALPSTNPSYGALTIYNAGSKDAYFIQGDVTAMATTANVRLPAGASITVWASGAYLAAITANTDTTTLYLYQANGPVEFKVPTAALPTGAATSANQTSTQAVPGSDAVSAMAVQGITGGKSVSVQTIPTSDATTGIIPVFSTALESCHVLKNAPGNLYWLTVTTQAVNVVIQVFNATSAPSDGAVTPVWSQPIVSNGTFGGNTWSWPIPVAVTTGIVVCASSATTPFTKTASATTMFSAGVK